MNEQKPNLFIVGAPKSGTTALNNYLARIPEIFMARKELHFFGSDLDFKHSRINIDDYLNHYKQAGKYKIGGDASVWYLLSKLAAEEIHDFNPEAKIIIMLRNPLSLLPSLHQQFLFDGDETIKDFEKAYHLDHNRKEQNQFLETTLFNRRPFYEDVVLYYKQIERYLKVFNRSQIEIILLDELIANPKSVLNHLLSWLGVDKHETQFPKANEFRTIHWLKLHHQTKSPSPILRSFFRILIPNKPMRHWIMQKVENRNVRLSKNKGVPIPIQSEIIHLIHPDIKSLEKLLGKDLSHWLI